jgi:hypothetical protein
MAAQLEPVRSRHSLPVVAWASAAVSVAGIWVMIALAGAVAPDFVSGSQHEHLKLVGGGDWIWGLVATAFVVLAVQLGIRLRVMNPGPWIALALGVSAVWAGVLYVTATSPVMVTGTDPTIIPFAAMGAPILGVFLTWFVCTVVKSAFEQDA